MPIDSLVSEKQLIPVERPRLFRALDKPGYIPIIGGAPVGVTRIVCGVVGAFFAGIGALCACRSDKWYGRFTFAANYLLGEATRGVSELMCFSYYSDKKKAADEANNIITDRAGAYGKYIYESPHPHGDMVYSRVNHQHRLVKWDSRTLGSEIHGVYGRIIGNKSTSSQDAGKAPQRKHP
jgi:hypothetical protein